MKKLDFQNNDNQHLGTWQIFVRLCVVSMIAGCAILIFLAMITL